MTVLLVEDDILFAKSLKRFFKAKKYEMTHVVTCCDAYGLLSKNSYKLIVSDFHLPDGYGTDVLRTAVAERKILISGTLDYCVEFEFYRKPLSSEELVQILGEANADPNCYTKSIPIEIGIAK